MAGKKRKSSRQHKTKSKKMRVSNEESSKFGEKGPHLLTHEELSHDSSIAQTKQSDSTGCGFISLPWFLDSIASVALCLDRREVPLVCGPIGCGKTSVIDFLANKRSMVAFKMQISEQTDTKSLLGAYCCSNTPGVFVWRPGPLIHCMTSGMWLVLEDVDKGSADLPILLSPVLRRMKDTSSQILHPNTGEPVQPHPHFRLILTRRTISSSAGYTDQSSESEIYFSNCTIIHMNGMPPEIIEKIIEIRNPSLLPLSKRLLSEFPLLQRIAFPSSQDQRPVCSRDFFKFIARAEGVMTKKGSAVDLYLNALECFVCSQPCGSSRDEVAIHLGGLFNFTREEATKIWQSRKPDLNLNRALTQVEAGRAVIPIRKSIHWELQLSKSSSEFGGQIFAETRLACALVEQLAVAVERKEPVLLVGETGTGKTSAVQRLARLAGRRLRVLNLNQQSDSVDLLGGFKPVDSRALVNPARERFESLFVRTFRLESNRQFLGHIQTCVTAGRWRDLLTLLRHPTSAAIRKLSTVSKQIEEASSTEEGRQKATLAEWQALSAELDSLERRLGASGSSSLAFAFIEGALVRALEEGDWVLLDEINLAPAELLDCLAGLLDSSRGSVTLVDRGDLEPVLRHRDFHLFAAMNPSTDVGKRELPMGLRNRFTELRVPELEPNSSSADRADLEMIVRAYLCPLGPSAAHVAAVVALYAALRKAAAEGIVDGVGQRPCFSLRTLCRALTEASRGYHGSLLRSLYEGFLFSFGSQVGRSSRPMLERLIQSHLLATLPQSSSTKDKSVLVRQLFSKPLPAPPKREGQPGFVCVEGYWVPRGPLEIPDNDEASQRNYVLTNTVRGNLRDLARVVSAAGSLPVLLQGETSVGKTSLITYLAARVGQVCHRINNHEHTDLQTYLGAYTTASASSAFTSGADNFGSVPLVFQEGIFVQAMKQGHWIILDELNLAPTEILEALNRVLDENRELFITETQEMVKAHPHFRVFATQNPPGVYAGRKVLSRALRNRFVELHFDPLPRDELEVILEHRSALPRSRAAKMVEVMHQLQLIRRASDIFQGKDGFITLRDLFRWGERYRLATCDQKTRGESVGSQLFDWDAYLAEQGYILLAGRARHPEEAKAVADVIQKVFKKQVVEANLYDVHGETSSAAREFLAIADQALGAEFGHVVWTRDLRRLLVLVGNALKYNEPILLVGETGCGKTTICQIFAALQGQALHCVNCHQYTEAADFLGGLRPVRSSRTDEDDDRLFEWVDGPLVVAMLKGESFLLDEISLADDAVLERLNSLLEPERRLCLAERCGDATSAEEITAAPAFRLLATMNPGGDYAKKELSPALRNRFTEIWCPSPIFLASQEKVPVEAEEDWRAIALHNLCRSNLPLKPLAAAVVDFCWWFARSRADGVCGGKSGCCRRPPPTIRDLLAWVEFIQKMVTARHDNSRTCIFNACLHGAALIFLDSLEDGSEGKNAYLFMEEGDLLERLSGGQRDWFKFNPVGGINYLLRCLLVHFGAEEAALNDSQLVKDVSQAASEFVTSLNLRPGQFVPELRDSNRLYGCEPFFIETGPEVSPDCLDSTRAPLAFSLSAATPASNLCRLLRALQLPRRALLLEGSPGVGKTSLVSALARAAGHHVVRINLSEATEASDLFGCDLPVEGAGCGTFAWRDGPLLQALRHGHWILLDEMNLASQSVLECLNACLDHRGAIYIPELGTTFHVEPRATRLFACQNPVEEGGGRRALPKSFLNRFTQVYLKPLTIADQVAVLSSIYIGLPSSHIEAMTKFNSILQEAIERGEDFTAVTGCSWEFNLRDLCRWGDLLIAGQREFGINPGLYVYLLYAARMRSDEDKIKVVEIWNSVAEEAGLGRCYVPRGCTYPPIDGKLQIGLATWAVENSTTTGEDRGLLILNQHRPYLEMLLKILQHGWMSIVIGPRGAGKRSLVHLAACLAGARAVETVALSPSADTVELLGAFEQRENGGVFAWIDSPLVRGIRLGHWVILENAQLCSPSVLDRLNSLLEPGGDLLISERGLDENGDLMRLKPHPDFRLVLVVDENAFSGAGCNNISRAMRNRGVELVLTHNLVFPKEDLHRLMLSTGLSPDAVGALLAFENSALERLDAAGSTTVAPIPPRRPPVGALLSAARMVQQLMASSDVDDVMTCSAADGGEEFAWMKMWRGDRVKRAFAKALTDIYARRQTDRNFAKLFMRVIFDFVDTELPALLSSAENSLLPRLNGANELLRGLLLTDQWRYLLHCVSSISPLEQRDQLFPILVRLSTERGFEVKPSALEAKTTEDFLSCLPGSIDNMDARWVPGWHCIIDRGAAKTISSWNSRIVDAFLSQLDRNKSRILATTASLTFGENTPVVCALERAAKDDVPVNFSEAYPGLKGLYNQLLSAFTGVREAFCSAPHANLDFYGFLSALAKLNAWLQHFGSQPVGAASDWPEKREFYSHYCKSPLSVASAARLMELMHRYLPSPIPRALSPSAPLNLCHFMWARLALEAHDQISSRLNPSHMEEDGDVDKEVEVVDLPSSKTSGALRLWPVLATGLVFSQRAVDLTIPWPEHLSERLLVDLGVRLSALSRPRLLELLTSASEGASENISEMFRLAHRTYSPLELADLSGLMKPDLVNEWQSLSQAVMAVNHANTMNAREDGVTCSFADWIAHQQTLSDLFHLLQHLAPFTEGSHRSACKTENEISELLCLSKSLFVAILTAIHKCSRGRMSDESAIAVPVSDVVAPLMGASLGSLEVFVSTLETYVSSLLDSQPILQLLLRAFCAFLKEPSQTSVARAWIVWGALQMRCAFPASPLDPSIVNAFKMAITRDELLQLNVDLQVRAALRTVEVGACGLPCLSEESIIALAGCVDSETVHSNVEAGLEHPLVSGIVRRRDKIADRLERLKKRQVVECENAALQLRATSNSEYAELRRKLTTFNQNFSGDFLLKMLENGFGLASGELNRWVEAAADLSEWFLQPRYLQLYADVVQPYLLGVAKVAHGLRSLVQMELARDQNAKVFANLVGNLTAGLFPTLATSTTEKFSGVALSPCLELVRQLRSPKVQSLVCSPAGALLWRGCEGVAGTSHHRSIYTDTRDVTSHLREVTLLRLEAEYRLNSHILDLLILDNLSSSSSASFVVDYTARFLRSFTAQLAGRWRRREARRKREAERSAALFIEAESRRRRCLDELHSTASAVSGAAKAKRGGTRAERRKRRQQAEEEADLPELIDSGLNEEVEWRLRFSEAGAIEARRALSTGGSNFMELRLSREDAIQQAVRNIESVNSWYEQELASAGGDGAEASTEWLPADSELVDFIDRLFFLLRRLTRQRQHSLDNFGDLVDKHWWRTFLEGYRFAGHLLAHSKYKLPSACDGSAMPSHLLATARLALCASTDESTSVVEKIFAFEPLQQQEQRQSEVPQRRRRCLDVYRDPIPKTEARKAHALMIAVRTRVMQVLEEWPDHPALLKIVTVIGRMCSFSMNDCLMKYITAFEMLLAEMQEWEKNASRHVSLSEAFRSVCDLLVDWRKLELKCWMAALDAATEAAADRVAPLWFHMHGVFLTSAGKTSGEPSAKELEEQSEVLLEFMENGPVGEFRARCRLLHALHHALSIWPGLSDKRRSASLQIVGNVTWFYSQFIPHVNKFLLDQQKPIRKEMRNFISIMKWGDYIGFWTLKDNVNRCKRTIHKHIRSWESLLRQSVKPCFEAGIKVSIETPIPSSALSVLENVNAVQADRDRGVFSLSQAAQQWILQLEGERELPVNVRRLAFLTKRFRTHVVNITEKAPCISWIRQLQECLSDWLERVKGLSRATQELDAASPSHNALIAVLNEKEGGEQPGKKKSVSEADLEKAREWTSRYTALQQQKKRSLTDWFRLSFGRRRLNSAFQSKKTEADHETAVIFPDDDEVEESEVQPAVDDIENEEDPCLGLSYRRGLRKSLFEKPHAQLLLGIVGDLLGCAMESSRKSANQLERLIAFESVFKLRKAVSDSLARLLSLRSGLPKHPENPEVVGDLGGREGVERLIGALDDLLVNCVDAFKPLEDLFNSSQKLQLRIEEIRVSYSESPAEDVIHPCDLKTLQKLKASRQRIADLASSCVKQWTKFSETCSSLTAPTSEGLRRLLAANAEYLPMENSSCDLPRLLVSYRGRLEDIAGRLDQRIPEACIAITGNIISQQELLKAAAQDFRTCCHEIRSQNHVKAIPTSGLDAVVDAISVEIKRSSDLIASISPPRVSSKSIESRVNALISKVLISLQDLKSLDENVEVERGMIDQLRACVSALSSTCIPKLEALVSNLGRLSPTSPEEVYFLQSIIPLLTSLADAVSVRLRQILGLLMSWITLGEFLAQVAFRLLNDGFCKPSALSKASAAAGDGKEGSSSADDGAGGENTNKDKDDDGGCTSLNAEGVDTSGAKDVSKELQSQEQIEGTMEEKSQRDKQPPELNQGDDEQGIEMPDDFEGALDDGTGREEKKPGNDSEEEKEDELQGVDEQMGEAGDEPDELNQEMWASDGEDEDKDDEDEDKVERKNADLNEAGVKDKENLKSKASKSTAVNETPQEEPDSSEQKDEEEGEEENNGFNEEDESAAPADDSKAAKAAGSKTVAGNDKADDDKDDKKDDASEAMKADEQRLAQQEVELIEEEEKAAGEEGQEAKDALDEFGENMNLEPNPEEFDDVNESDVSEEQLDLKGDPVETEDGEDKGMGDVGFDESDERDDSKPPEDQLVTEYQSGAGDLNSGNNGAYDGNSAMNEDEMPQTDKGDVAEGADGNEDVQQQSMAGGGGKDTGQFSAGASSAPNEGGPSEAPASRQQQQQGPRPTSDRRTTAQADKTKKTLRQTEVLEADEETQQPSSSRDETNEEEGEGDAVQHVSDENAEAPLTIFDSANTDQQQEQTKGEEDVEMSEELDENADPGADLNQKQPAPPEELEPPKVDSQSPSTRKPPNTANKDDNKDAPAAPGTDKPSLPKVDMELVPTLSAQRAPESIFNTTMKSSASTGEVLEALQQLDTPLFPSVVENRRCERDSDATAAELALEWRACVSRSAGLSVQLCEALRLVLEPTRASRMKGDFRTGKRLNMRKIIPYLASQFRKDKIWMRRTQPNQRDYKILIAVDNSSSMADNLCKQMTFEALATVINALNLLEAGEIGVCGFGEAVEVVHGLGQPWTNDMGPSMLAQFDFTQTRTSLIQLLRSAVEMMQATGEGSRSDVPASQLLLILTDGAFSEDPQSPALQAAVRLARDHRLFVVCVIIDDVKKKHSIFDIRRYAGPGKLMPYMDVFPLPFYLVLRDVTALPRLLAEALRQWFELAASLAEASMGSTTS